MFCLLDADDSDDRVSVASEPDQLLYGRPSGDSMLHNVTLARAFSEGHSPAHSHMASASEVRVWEKTFCLIAMTSFVILLTSQGAAAADSRSDTDLSDTESIDDTPQSSSHSLQVKRRRSTRMWRNQDVDPRACDLIKTSIHKHLTKQESNALFVPHEWP